MSKQTVGIIGVGEVGKAIKKLAASKFKVFLRDLSFDEISGNHIDFLHLCFPYSPNFISIATKAIKEIKPSLVIVNSTVKPGTTKEIYHQTNIPIAHTPIMGVHPNLAKYQSIFDKVVGAIDENTFKSVSSHWKELGSSRIVRFDSPTESELAKVLSTTYYGWNIVFNKAAKKLTDKYKANFDQVYTKFNQIYNAGYKESLPYVTRPILKHVDGEIGGHCVLPNASFMTDDELFVEFIRLAKKFS